jgi:hypothetical protein
MTVLARRILDDLGFDPGFGLAPERLETLRAALRVAARDLPTRGIEGEPEIEILEDWFPVGAGVRLADGERLNWDGPILPNMRDDPAMALTSLAILIQESLLEWTWQVWPVLCPGHDPGVHVSERDREVVWWCAGDGGHMLAPVGELARSRPPSPGSVQQGAWSMVSGPSISTSSSQGTSCASPAPRPPHCRCQRYGDAGGKTGRAGGL